MMDRTLPLRNGKYKIKYRERPDDFYMKPCKNCHNLFDCHKYIIGSRDYHSLRRVFCSRRCASAYRLMLISKGMDGALAQ